MRRAVLICTGVLFAVALGGAALALEFSADMVSRAQGHTSESKLFVKDQKSRMEPKGQPTYTIMRGDKQVVWMVMPEQKSYMEMTPNPAQQPKTEEKVQGEVSRKLVGSETIDGHPTQKYEVTYTEPGKTEKVQMYQWIATDIKFPVKMAAVDGSWTVEYKNIKIGSQPEKLFEVPSDYKKTSMPGMPSLPDMPKMPKMPKMPGFGGKGE